MLSITMTTIYYPHHSALRSGRYPRQEGQRTGRLAAKDQGHRLVLPSPLMC